MPLVSVIMYVRNGMPYFQDALDSVVSQTLHDIEIIIVDGGSTDGTIEIADKSASADSRIRILHCDKASVGAQFNLGLQNASGKYIAICESDDTLLPDMYERLSDIANRTDIDFIKADHWYIKRKSGKRYRCSVCPDQKLYGKVIANHAQIDFLDLPVYAVWSGLYNRHFLLENSIYMNETPGASYQDTSFTFLCEYYADKIWFDKTYGYEYTVDNENASMFSKQAISKCILEYSYLRTTLKKRNLWKKAKRQYYAWKLSSLFSFLKEMHGKQLRDNLSTVWNEINEDEIELPDSDRGNSLRQICSLNANEFNSYFESIEQINADMITYFRGRYKNDNIVVIVGAGHLGQCVAGFFTCKSQKVYLSDNSAALQQSGIDGKHVYKTEEITKYYPDATYIIANAKHYNDIKIQLENLGIRKENIVICSDEVIFTREI